MQNTKWCMGKKVYNVHWRYMQSSSRCPHVRRAASCLSLKGQQSIASHQYPVSNYLTRKLTSTFAKGTQRCARSPDHHLGQHIRNPYTQGDPSPTHVETAI